MTQPHAMKCGRCGALLSPEQQGRERCPECRQPLRLVRPRCVVCGEPGTLREHVEALEHEP